VLTDFLFGCLHVIADEKKRKIYDQYVSSRLEVWLTVLGWSA
jgi:hypothetical protein